MRYFKPILPVEKRIMLHLELFVFQSEPYIYPRELAQEGISAHILARQDHVSKALKNLCSAGLVCSKLGRIEGGRRKKQVYLLTVEGRAEVKSILAVCLSQELTVRFEDGRTKRVKLSELSTLTHISVSPLDVLLRLEPEGLLDIGTLKQIQTVRAAVPGAVAGLPSLHQKFFGRALELKKLAGWLRDPEKRLIVITGLAGTGKTALADFMLGCGHRALKLYLSENARPELEDCVALITRFLENELHTR